MKKLLLLACLLLVVSRLSAASYIVYSKGDYSLVTATVPSYKPTDPTRGAFLAAVQGELAKPAGYETHMTLIAPPVPAWGKIIEGAKGEFQFHETFKGGYLLHVKLEGLAPGRLYRLCLNGNPKLEGNDRLPDPVKGMPEERYMDFFTATADPAGRYDAIVAVALRTGRYDVRLYVKDMDDHTIFLYHDYFRFTVE